MLAPTYSFLFDGLSLIPIMSDFHELTTKKVTNNTN
jgi:hypothetical protein